MNNLIFLSKILWKFSTQKKSDQSNFDLFYILILENDTKSVDEIHTSVISNIHICL